MKSDGGLRKTFRDHLPVAQWTSIETGSTAAGVPDSFVCFRGGLVRWLEYKLTKANAVRLSAFQIAWHQQYARYGGTSFIAIRRKREACDELYLFAGEDVASVAKHGLKSNLVLGMWPKGPAKWNWPMIREILTEAGR